MCSKTKASPTQLSRETLVRTALPRSPLSHRLVSIWVGRNSSDVHANQLQMKEPISLEGEIANHPFSGEACKIPCAAFVSSKKPELKILISRCIAARRFMARPRGWRAQRGAKVIRLSRSHSSNRDADRRRTLLSKGFNPLVWSIPSVKFWLCFFSHSYPGMCVMYQFGLSALRERPSEFPCWCATSSKSIPGV